VTLSAKHVSKSFGATRAVDDVSLRINPGEIVGLIGENGAGKTTLMRIVAGELRADSGEIHVAPRPSAARAARGGGATSIGFVHQHFMLVNDFTIAENLALATGARPRDAESIIAASGIELRDVARRARDLAVGEKSKLELIKAIARRPELLILDEPTSVLTPLESEELFRVMRRIADEGTAVVFISHKIREVIEVATRVVVMRSGKVVAESATMTPEELATAMVGAPRVDFASEVRTRTGEIVAIVGVAGNGQRELADAMLREHPRSRVGFIPEDRTRDGLVAEMTIAENVALTAEDWRAAMRRTPELIKLYSIRAQGPAQLAGSLSGGNQQKVILARELDRQPERIIAAEPTRGLDIESTRFVHRQLDAAAARGAHIVLITSDLDEAFALADAIQVIYRGRLSERMPPGEASSRVASLMAGLA
jgi:general nucleoside transport system ATP-binding protein